MPPNMNNFALPTSLTVGGVGYQIRSGWSHVIKVLIACADPGISRRAKSMIILRIVYPDWKNIPAEHIPEAIRKANEFIDCGQTQTGGSKPKLIDWEQDARIIVPEINKIAGTEIRANPELHWWTVWGWFMGIEKGLLANVLSIRRKLASGKKLDKYENEYYRENKALIDLKQPNSPEQASALADIMEWMEG